MPLTEAFKRADDVLLNAVQGISDMVQMAGLVNVDFADVKTIMQNQGLALMGTGRASGSKRSVEAMQMAISSPPAGRRLHRRGSGNLVNITGPRDISLAEIDEAVGLIQNAADPDVNIIFGALVDETPKDEVKITLIATGFQPAKDGRSKGLSPGLSTPSRNAVRAPARVIPKCARPKLLTDRRVEMTRTPASVPGDDGAMLPPGLPGLEKQYDIRVSSTQSAQGRIAAQRGQATNGPLVRFGIESATMEKQRRILLVDDSATIRQLLKFGLSRIANATCDEAADGQQALKMVDKQHYDLILADINMPVMDGLKMLEELRRKLEHRSHPRGDDHHRGRGCRSAEGHREGRSAYLTKPVQIPQFLEVVEGFLLQNRSALARRPLHLAPGDEVQVQVRHGRPPSPRVLKTSR